MKKFLKIFKACLKIIETLLTIVVVGISIIIVTQRVSNNEKSVLGYRIFRIETGSMVPNYLVGDVILVKECDINNLKPGDNITYNGLTGDVKGKTITHQIVAVNTENSKITIRTKGIANNVADPEIDGSQVIGKVIVKLNILTWLTKFINNKYIFYFFIIVPLTIWIFFNVIKRKADDLEEIYKIEEAKEDEEVKEDKEKINEDVENDDGKIEDETEEQEDKEKLPNEETESLNDDETKNVLEESKEKENNDEEN